MHHVHNVSRSQLLIQPENDIVLTPFSCPPLPHLSGGRSIPFSSYSVSPRILLSCACITPDYLRFLALSVFFFFRLLASRHYYVLFLSSFLSSSLSPSLSLSLPSLSLSPLSPTLFSLFFSPSFSHSCGLGQNKSSLA